LQSRGQHLGRFIAAMLDDTLGPTLLVKTSGTRYCATIDLNISFLTPARPGRFIGTGRIMQLGKTITFLEGELRDASNAVVARYRVGQGRFNLRVEAEITFFQDYRRLARQFNLTNERSLRTTEYSAPDDRNANVPVTMYFSYRSQRHARRAIVYIGLFADKRDK
jgi:uncharacterized protein (TIGR00369 family)